MNKWDTACEFCEVVRENVIQLYAGTNKVT